MPIVGGLDIRRKQLTFDYADTGSGEVRRGQIAPAGPRHRPRRHGDRRAGQPGRRAGQPVHPRDISFTATRRAVIASVRSGAATASLPAALTAANRDAILADLARRRVQVDRHRDRKTQARPGFPAGGPRLITRTAPAQISISQPLTA